MRAMTYEAYGVGPSIHEIPDPSCHVDGVVIRVEATGLCRSDWHAWQGHDPDVRLPHVGGHELAGSVIQVGSNVRRWSVGDRVTTPFVCACGACEQCRSGHHQVCDRQEQPGFTYPGSFAEQVAIPSADVNLVGLPESLNAVVAASLGCRFATAYRAVTTLASVQAGETVAVFGCGGVGLSAIMVAVARGARVIAIDVASAARVTARDLGAEITLDGGDASVVAEVVAASDGGANVTIDAVGSMSTCVRAIESLRKRGRHVQVGLMLAIEARPRIPMDRVIAWELVIRGGHGMPAHEYPPMMSDIADGVLRPQLLIGKTVFLSEAPAALAAMSSPTTESGITVVLPNRREIT